MSSRERMIPEDRIREALAPRRADGPSFLEGVERRLAAGEAADPLAGATPFQKAAAAFLPPFLTGLPAQAAAGTTGKNAGVFGAASLLAAPAVSLLAILGMFWWGLRAVGDARRTRPEDDGAARARAMGAWWRRAWPALAGGAVLAGVVLAASPDVATAATLLLVGSFAALAFMARALAARGVVQRPALAAACGQLLMIVGFLAQNAQSTMTGQEAWTLDPAWAAAVLLFGACACFAVPFLRDRRRALALLLVAPLLAVAVWFAARAARPAAPTKEELIRFVETYDVGRFGGASWGHWAVAAGHALETGVDPDLGHAARDLAVTENPYVLGAAARVGMLDAARRERLLAEHERQVERWLDPDAGPSVMLDQKAWIVGSLAARPETTEAQRDLLARKLLALWPEPRFEVLRDMELIVSLLDALGRPIDVAAYAPSVHEALMGCWVDETSGLRPSGGFARDPARSDYAEEEPTWQAVELMARFGVPDAVDLGRVRAYLRSKAKPILGDRNGQHMTAAVAFDRLERRLAADAEAGLAARIASERFLIGAVLLVVLCLLAVTGAPPGAVRRR